VKYLQSGGFQHNPLMRLTLGLALALLAGFWVTNLALWFTHMTLDPASVVAYYRGDEAEFLPPRSARGMLEVTHMHLPMFALVLLLLTHLLIFAPIRQGAKVAFVVASFGSALLMEAAGWMTRFWHPGFAWLKVGMFVLFQALLLGLLAGLGAFLIGAERFRRRRHADRARTHAPADTTRRPRPH
jgi:hypothetical protein